MSAQSAFFSNEINISEIERAILLAARKHDLNFEDVNIHIEDDGNVSVDYEVISAVVDEIRFYGNPDAVDIDKLATTVISSWYKLHLENHGVRNQLVDFLMQKQKAECNALQNGYRYAAGHA